MADDPNSMAGLENHPLLAPVPAKKRGRPPGSKNKKTLEAIQMKAEGTGLEPVVLPVDPVPEEAVVVAAAASGILEATPSTTLPEIGIYFDGHLCAHGTNNTATSASE